jgi:hypothetical protein
MTLFLLYSLEILFTRLGILPLPCEYIFSLMNFVVNNQEHLKKQLNTILTQGIETISIDQLPTFHVLKKVHTFLASKYSSLP